MRSRSPVIDAILGGIDEAGGRIVSCSFPDRLVAPIFVAAEDQDGHRYGLLLYPFTTTRRATRNRPKTEHRFQVRYGEPSRVRNEQNPLGHDPSGADVTLVLAVDPERELIVGLDPLVYAQLPMGCSGYYREEHVNAVLEAGWAAWTKEKGPKKRIRDWEGLETMVGFRPERILEYARFEALATSLGLEAALRLRLAERFASRRVDRHELERLFGIDAGTILDIVDANFRLGVAVRGSVAEHHLGLLLANEPGIAAYQAIDQDGQPDFRVTLHDGRTFTIECKNALRETYSDGTAKVETQKTRDSGNGRKYTFDAFDIVAACMFSVTGRWTFKFKAASKLVPWTTDSTRIGAIQRVDESWLDELDEVFTSPFR